jgi:pSer/pThr/pTyr-binding forkhead associated (FHA) protein
MTTTSIESLATTTRLPAMLDRHRRGAVANVPRLPAGWYLAVEDGEELTIVALEPGTFHIGRSPSADLSFEDPTVSRRHAMIVMDEAGPRVLDDRSRNGVHHNGERVSEAHLRHGDVLAIGRQRLRVVLVETETATAEAGAAAAT